jgi:hypothetical protein
MSVRMTGIVKFISFGTQFGHWSAWATLAM